MKAYPRERFSAEVTLTPPLVTTYAQAAGGNNPVHHNPDFAAATDVGHAEKNKRRHRRPLDGGSVVCDKDGYL